jgi:hypothetical protein
MLFLLLLCCKWLYKITYLVFGFSCYEARNIFDEFVLYMSVRQDFLAFRRVCSETVRIVPRMLFSDISGVYVLRAEWSVWLETVCCVVLCCVCHMWHLLYCGCLGLPREALRVITPFFKKRADNKY